MSSINKKIDDIANEHYAGNNSAFAKVMGTSEANIRNYRKETMPKLEFVVKLREGRLRGRIPSFQNGNSSFRTQTLPNITG